MSSSKKKDKDKSKKDKESKSIFKIFRKTKEGFLYDRTSESIPLVVSEPISWLRSHNAMGEEGIFRVPGSATEIKLLKAKYDKGKKVDLEALTNIHTVAGILKVFFREMPEPLLTFELYEAWLAAVQAPELPTQLEFLQKVLSSLPPGNRVILKELMGFLFEVSHIPSNCMNATNLAIVFAPNLIRPRLETMETILMSSSYVNSLIQILIMYYEQIFLSKPLPVEGVQQVTPLAPHLISLKAAQEKAHGKAVTIADDLAPPVSPRDKPKLSPRKSNRDLDAAPVSPRKSGHHSSASTGGSDSGSSESTKHRKTLGETGRLMTSSSIISKDKRKESKSDKKDGKRVRNTVLLGETPSERRGSVGTDRKSFYETLKAGTLSLAATLLEEQDLKIEVEEVERLTGQSRAEAEERLRLRLEQEKKNARVLKRAHRTSRKLRDSAILEPSFLSIFKQAEGGADPAGTTTPAQSGQVVPAPTVSSAPSDDLALPPALPDLPPPLAVPPIVSIPVALPPLEEGDDDSGSGSDDESSDDSDSESDDVPDPMVSTLGAALPPPIITLSDQEDDNQDVKSKLEQNIAIKAKISDVVEKVAEGDLDELASFMGQMKTLSRMERQKSKKVLLQRMQIKREQIETILSDSEDSADGTSSSHDQE